MDVWIIISFTYERMCVCMNHREKALDYFKRKFHCSQAVLAAFADDCGLTEEQALRLGACFGSGMRKGEVWYFPKGRCGICTWKSIVYRILSENGCECCWNIRANNRRTSLVFYQKRSCLLNYDRCCLWIFAILIHLHFYFSERMS